MIGGHAEEQSQPPAAAGPLWFVALWICLILGASSVSLVAARSPAQRFAVAVVAAVAGGSWVLAIRLRLLRPASRTAGQRLSWARFLRSAVPLGVGLLAADIIGAGRGGLPVKVGPLLDAGFATSVSLFILVGRRRPTR